MREYHSHNTTPLLAIMSALALILSACASGGVASEEAGYKIYRMGHYAQAMRVWKRAVSKGDAGAAYRLGEEYLDAKVVERDMEKALFYLRKSAEAGDPRAQMEMGSLYDNGQGVLFSHEDAARWYLAAARQGLPEAQHNIAVMYEGGEGIARDIPRAYLYYNLAIENNFTRFSEPALAQLVVRMTPRQIEEGERLLELALAGIEERAEQSEKEEEKDAK